MAAQKTSPISQLREDWRMWPFGKKVVCFQCDKKVKLKVAILRRGFHLCSPGCLTAFLAANQFPRPPGDERQLREELGNLLVAALGELARVPGSHSPFTGERKSKSGFTYRPGGGLGSAVAYGQERHANEEALDAIQRFNAHATSALPYLAALELRAGFERFDTLDVEALSGHARWRRVEHIDALMKDALQILDDL